MLDGGTNTGGLYPRKHELYDYAVIDAGIYVPTCIAGDEVFLATSKMGTDTQTGYRHRVSVPLIPGVGVSAPDVLSHLGYELYRRDAFRLAQPSIPDLAAGSAIRH